MKNLFLGLSLLVVSTTAFSKDILNERFEGMRESNGQVCVLEHRQLQYSYPELFISFHSNDNESFKLPDAGLLEAMGIDYPVYKLILYGTENVSINANKGIYDYTIKASTISNPSLGSVRTIEIEGVSNASGGIISSGTIVLVNSVVESISISKQTKNFFSGWKTVFSDSCHSISKGN